MQFYYSQVLSFLFTFITKKTKLGRHIYAIGGNSHAAELSGINNKRVTF